MISSIYYYVTRLQGIQLREFFFLNVSFYRETDQWYMNDLHTDSGRNSQQYSITLPAMLYLVSLRVELITKQSHLSFSLE